MPALGRTGWAVPGGHIPPLSSGAEPTFTSRDELALLNTGDSDAEVEIEVHHTDRDPVGPYRLKVQARRLRKVRLNDLIFPEAIFLDADYAAIIRSSLPILVQFSRLDSGSGGIAETSTLAFAGP